MSFVLGVLIGFIIGRVRIVHHSPIDPRSIHLGTAAQLDLRSQIQRIQDDK